MIENCFPSLLSLHLRLQPHLFVVLLQRRQILPSLWELPFFHTLPHIPMHKRPLGIHQIKLMINSRKHFGYWCSVRYHAYCAHNFCHIATWDDCGGLVVDADFEACGAPVDEFDCSLGFYCLDSWANILRNDITTIHQRARHILSMSGITFRHHIRWLEHIISNLLYIKHLMIRLLRRYNWRIRRQHKMYPRIGH